MRRDRERPTGGRSLAGERFELEVGPLAHGGHCVARLPAEVPEVGGTVVFVRHALPGELATVVITEGRVGDRFLRGDALEVARASADRVTPPCRYAGPGLCGGCDFQHVALPAQRRLKADVIAEQLRRIAGLDVNVEVEAVPGDADGLRWRTRMRLHRVPGGGTGLRAHRSSTVVPIDDCLLQAPGAEVLVEGEPVPEHGRVELVRGQRFTVAAGGFWQGHLGAPEVLVDAVLGAADVSPGDRVLDLYCGVGLFSAFLARETGEQGDVVSVEGNRVAADLARANLAAYPWVRVERGSVGRVLARDSEPADVVVLDPPREGARRPVVDGVAARGPRRVVLVACDPASLARDVSLFAAHGYHLAALRAFDLFPMTHHVESVATLTLDPSGQLGHRVS